MFVNDNWGDVQEDGVWWKLRHCSGGSGQSEADRAGILGGCCQACIFRAEQILIHLHL